jgi:hypothetical protein
VKDKRGGQKEEDKKRRTKRGGQKEEDKKRRTTRGQKEEGKKTNKEGRGTERGDHTFPSTTIQQSSRELCLQISFQEKFFGSGWAPPPPPARAGGIRGVAGGGIGIPDYHSRVLRKGVEKQGERRVTRPENARAGISYNEDIC